MKSTENSPSTRALLVLMLTTALLSGCSTSGTPTPGPAPTATSPTATAPAAAPAPAITPPNPTPLAPAPAAPVSPSPTVVPTATPAGRWSVYSNANFVRGVAVYENRLYAATEGGVVAFDLTTGEVVHKWTTLDGLTHNLATSVVVCSVPEPRVIVGTEKGLNLYDPKTDRWDRLTRSAGRMASNEVAALLCDNKTNTLIIGYDSSGVDFFNAQAGTWGHVGQKEGLASDFINAMAISPDMKDVWVASPFGASVISGQNVKVYDKKVTKLASDGVSGIAVDSAGNVWWGMFEGLVRFSKGSYKLITDKTVAGLPFGTITTIAPAPDGSVWVGTGFGDLCHLDAAAQKCLTFKGMPAMSAGLNSLLVDGKGQVYYASDGQGVSRYDGSGWRLFQVKDEMLASNRISAIAEDKEGAVWIATDNGVNKLNPADDKTPWELITASDTGLPDNVVTALAANPTGGMWFAAGAPALLQGSKWTVLTTNQGLVQEAVTAIAVDGKGRTWFGTPAGISIWDGKKLTNMTKKEGLPDERVQALFADGDLVWVGTPGGLLRYDGKQWQSFTTGTAGLPSDDVNVISREPNGGLLVGTSGGLARFDGKRAAVVAEVAQDMITSIAVGKDGVVWVGTMLGAYRYDGAVWKLLTPADGLPTQRIMAVLVDHLGNVWFGGDGAGVARYTP